MVRHHNSKFIRVAFAATLLVSGLLAGSIHPVTAQQAPTAQSAAPIDLIGTWVSVVTEEWRWRMVTPPKGDYQSIPLTDEARKVGDTWDPAKDTAEGNACRAYGAIGVMRMPARIRVDWQNENTLKLEIDAGQQTRLFRFGATASRTSGEADWQGSSAARWLAPGGGDLPRPGRGGPVPGAFGAAGGGGAQLGRGGSLIVETTNMKPGYIRKNGIPYSENARLTERYVVLTTPDGNRWMTVQQVVQDPVYLNADYVTTWHFKREPNDAKFRPTPCNAS